MQARHLFDLDRIEGPHRHQPVYAVATDENPVPDRAQWSSAYTMALIALHGRGAPVTDALGFGLELARRIAELGDDRPILVLAPEAMQRSWYPQRFLVPQADNQPHLRSALAAVSEIVVQLQTAGLSARRVALCGFSQGACLSFQSITLLPAPVAAVCGFSGGLIGTDQEVEALRPWAGAMYRRPAVPPAVTGVQGVPVFVGCGDRDFHIPVERVRQTSEVLRSLGAAVEEQIYPNLPHTIVEDELERSAALVAESLRVGAAASGAPSASGS